MKNSPIYLHTLAQPISIDLQETLRYMGSGTQPSDAVTQLAKRAICALEEVMACKACYRRAEVVFSDAAAVAVDGAEFYSKALRNHLEGCVDAFIFAATIGIEADRLILQYKRTEPSFALALQAAGAAAIECYCDYLCHNVFEAETLKSDMYIGRRFSPGYGDLPAECQKQIFDLLDCTRKIGLTLTENYMMMPSKSVTAFVGIGDKKLCTTDKCSDCTDFNCVFRKGRDM